MPRKSKKQISRETRGNRVDRVIKSGYSIREAINMTPKQWKDNIRLKSGKKSTATNSSIRGAQRNLRDSYKTPARKAETEKFVKEKRVKEAVANGFSGRGLEKEEKRITKEIEDASKAEPGVPPPKPPKEEHCKVVRVYLYDNLPESYANISQERLSEEIEGKLNEGGWEFMDSDTRKSIMDTIQEMWRYDLETKD